MESIPTYIPGLNPGFDIGCLALVLYMRNVSSDEFANDVFPDMDKEYKEDKANAWFFRPDLVIFSVDQSRKMKLFEAAKRRYAAEAARSLGL